MDAAGAASVSLGPSYAPEDPTLPKPWTGLIDGSTGLQYYWNPETNVTQYERPVAPTVSALPPVPPPSVMIPKVTASPMAQNPPTNSSSSSQLGEPQMFQQAGQAMQQIGPTIQLPYSQSNFQFHPQPSQQFQQFPPGHQFQLQQQPGQFTYPQSGQQLQQQQPGSYLQQQQLGLQQQPPGLQSQQPLSGLQLHSHQSGLQLQPQQPGQQVQQQQQQLPERLLQQHQPGQQMQPQQPGSQMQQPQQLGHQMQQHSQPISPQSQAGLSMQPTHTGGQQQMASNPQMHYSQVPYPQAQQMPTSQVQQPPLQPRIQLQGQQTGFHKVEQTANQYGTEVEYAFPQSKPSGGLPISTNLSSGNPQLPVRQSAVSSVQAEQQMLGPSVGDDPGASLVNKPQNIDGIKGNQQPGAASRATSQFGQAMPSNPLMATGPPPGVKEYREDPHVTARDPFYPNGSINNSPAMGLQQQKHSTYPSPQSMQTSRIGGSQPHNFSPGLGAGPGPGPATGFNSMPMKPMPGVTGQAIPGQPFPGSFPVRPLPGGPGLVGPTDFHDISAADVYRRQHEVTAMGENVPAPFMTFETTGFPPEILREMHFAGFMSPTPIQAQSWPLAIQGRDIVAIAKTGSGKTLGYLIPAFLHLRRHRMRPHMDPTVLVLAPTRELATQIQDEAMKFGRSSGVSCICLYGGAPKGPQLKEIEKGADIVIATPGRLNDFLEMNKIKLQQISFLVLDEADRMLDMGFEPQIRKVVNEIPPRRQTLMYTATWPKEVRKIAGDLLCDPVQVNIGSIDELVANKAITQYVEVVPPMDKPRRLEQILRAQERGSKIIIFCSTKKQCDQLARSIGRTFGAASIHGDKSQGERDWALNQFRSGKSPILVATDVAARGLDVKDIRVVINYDFPTGIEDYVHRIGRTGRAGASGVAYTFFSDQDWKYAADLIKVLEGANQRVPAEIREIATRGSAGPKSHDGTGHWEHGGGGPGRGGGGRWTAGFGRGQRDGGGPGGYIGGRGSPGGRNDFHAGGRGSPGGRNDFYGGGRGSPGGRSDFYGGGRGGPGGRNDFYGGRGGRGRGFGGPGGRGRNGPGPRDRYGSMDGRGRFDNRRMMGERNRDRSYSRSPDRGRLRAYDRGRSRSHSRSSRSWSSRSRSRSRSWSSRSRSRSRSRSHSRSCDQTYTRPPRVSGFDVRPPENVPPSGSVAVLPPAGFDMAGQSLIEASRPPGSSTAPASEYINPPASDFDPNPRADPHVPTTSREMSPLLHAANSGAFPESEAPVQLQEPFDVSLNSSGPGTQLDKSGG